MDEPYSPPQHPWSKKFATAFHGVWLGTRGHNSFVIHVPAAVLVMTLALYWKLPKLEICALLICITVVLSCELMNSALESMAKAVTRMENPFIAQSLDIASGAVLLAAIGAGIVGAIIFLPRVLL